MYNLPGPCCSLFWVPDPRKLGLGKSKNLACRSLETLLIGLHELVRNALLEYVRSILLENVRIFLMENVRIES